MACKVFRDAVLEHVEATGEIEGELPSVLYTTNFDINIELTTWMSNL